MTLKRISALVLLTATALAGCSAHSGTSTHQAKVSAAPSPSTTPSVSPVSEDGQWFTIGQPFQNGSFQVTITGYKLGLKEIDLDATAKSGGLKPFTPDNGQFVLVYVTAKNVGIQPEAVADSNSTLIDDRGVKYDSSSYGFGAVGQGFDASNQQPGVTRTGWFAFDVPASVTKVSGVLVQTDAYMATENEPTLVKLVS